MFSLFDSRDVVLVVIAWNHSPHFTKPSYAATLTTRFLAWTDEDYHDMVRFCFESEWDVRPSTLRGVQAIGLESPFYHLHTLCDEFNHEGVRKLIVDGNPLHIFVAEGTRHRSQPVSLLLLGRAWVKLFLRWKEMHRQVRLGWLRPHHKVA